MGLHWKMVGLFALVLLVGAPVNPGADDLIPPTRSLESPSGPLARLTVVSEPPGLEAFLDGSKVGDTPVWHKKVEPGLYALRVGDSESEVSLEPGKTHVISVFKGSFIDISKAREAAKRQAGLEPEKPAESGKRAQPRKDERPPDLNLWERFLTGTSPIF